ncbi:hypothetical protein [Oerskovia paurometabola]|uniref:hypothetical protein n=1 Tax=Oerskovia paurometabola TaxID=162170 RepID=UPI00382B3FA9
MAITAAVLLDLVGAGQQAPGDAELAQRCVVLAAEFVARYQAEQDPAGVVVIPPVVLEQAELSCAEDIWTRSKSENGVILTNYQPGDDGSGVTVRIGRDPLAPVRPLLRPWLPGVFAL